MSPSCSRYLYRHGKRHDIYANPKTGRKTPEPRHYKIKESVVRLEAAWIMTANNGLQLAISDNRSTGRVIVAGHPANHCFGSPLLGRFADRLLLTNPFSIIAQAIF